MLSKISSKNESQLICSSDISKINTSSDIKCVSHIRRNEKYKISLNLKQFSFMDKMRKIMVNFISVCVCVCRNVGIRAGNLQNTSPELLPLNTFLSQEFVNRFWNRFLFHVFPRLRCTLLATKIQLYNRINGFFDTLK